jgi:lipopolysaccharide/colanic/teichoic acid biosynthesis glycosyltransferase
LIDEYFQLYLLWSTFIFTTFYVLRFENISRWYLFLFSLFIPLILLIFRNTEFLSSLLGRSISSESFLSVNLDADSNFRNLRIITFRNSLGNLEHADLGGDISLIDKIDKVNKIKKINLIVLNLDSQKRINPKLEKYLIETNKKVLIISKNQPVFENNFLFRQETIDKSFFTYFNNDIQYGSKYILKRILDITLSCIGLVIFSPIMILLGLYILLIDGYPFFVKQRRVGLHGEPFNMFKFRTMKKNSHELRATMEELNKSDGPLFKIEQDPRILKGLSFARKFSIDELLQFINVIKGDMSIVGPRPLFDDDTQLFNTKYMRRLNVLPGITGLLQINERNTSEFETWYKYDIEYIENWSLYLDFKIILKTPFALFSKKIKGI